MSDSSDSKASGGQKLWGGRFEGGVDPVIDAYTRALGFDRRLALADVTGCLAHATMLRETGVLDEENAATILSGLAGLYRELEAGEIEIHGPDEDVHSWIERQLIGRIGDPGRRLHTARSRNDQTATALRLWLRGAIDRAHAALAGFQEALLDRAAQHLETWLPGYTHLQRGQPVSLAHHLLAHFWALEQDAQRLERARQSARQCPLGAGALASTPWPIRPELSAELLDFESVYPNSLFAVADRDYVLETSFACALSMVHLSRWAEEVVLWTSTEFGFAALGDSVAKGSSLMPQKRNPEPAEILRGKSGRVVGDLVAHLVQLKGLPLTYNSDLQEDKEALFDAIDTLTASLAMSRSLLDGLSFDEERMKAALHGGYMTATDLADALVEAGVPFRTAHESSGRVVKEAEAAGIEIWEMDDEALRALCPELPEGTAATLDPDSSVRRRRATGGPAPERVAEQLEQARALHAELRERVGHRLSPAGEPEILKRLRSATL